jgi:KipI family sensor histidine kinase inhibitor
MTFKIISVDTLMLYFEQVISEETLDQIQEVYNALKGLKGIVDLTPSYCSILVQFDIFTYDHEQLIDIIKEQTIKGDNQIKKQSKLITIPTNYNKNLDLLRVANHNSLSTEEVIALHTQTTYRVYAIGFMVGFAYLATLDPKIITPRHSTPRKKIPKGSVALADRQTAIYPQASAGGWNIIGETKFDDFHLFEIGDRVQFERV